MSYIEQFIVGKIARFPLAQVLMPSSDWLFVPQPAVVINQTVTLPIINTTTKTNGTISLANLSENIINQDFAAILVGDCNDNWQ